MKPTDGFTVIELLIVVIIIVIVGSVFHTHYDMGESMFWWLQV